MPAYFIRAEMLEGFLELCSRLELDATGILKSNNLSTQLISEADLLLPYRSVTGAMEQASRLSHRADFSSLLSHLQQPFPVGIPRLLMHRAPTIREALTEHSKHSHLHSSGSTWYLEETGSTAYMVREDKMAGKLPSFQYATLSLSHVVIAVRSLLKDDHWKPQQFQFSYSEPTLKPQLKRLFGTRIHYDQDRTAVVFDRDILDIPLRPEHEHEPISPLLQKKIQQLEEIQRVNYPTSTPNLIHKLEHWIRRHIHRDSCHLAALAKQLGLHPKKLQRELADQGLNFRKMKADIRLDMAEHYLRDSNFSLTSISILLDFGELSGFSRAFKHRHQCSPLAWRERHKINDSKQEGSL